MTMMRQQVLSPGENPNTNRGPLPTPENTGYHNYVLSGGQMSREQWQKNELLKVELGTMLLNLNVTEHGLTVMQERVTALKLQIAELQAKIK